MYILSINNDSHDDLNYSVEYTSKRRVIVDARALARTTAGTITTVDLVRKGSTRGTRIARFRHENGKAIAFEGDTKGLLATSCEPYVSRT